MSDTELDKLERKIERAEVRLEKLRAAEPGLRKRIADAKAQSRKRRVAELLTNYRAQAERFISAADVCTAEHNALVAIRSQARDEGFEAEAASAMPPAPNLNGSAVLARDLLALFAQQFESDQEAPRRAPAKVAKAAAGTAKRTTVWQPLTERWTPVDSLQSLGHAVRASTIGEPAGQLVMLRAQDDTALLSTREVRVESMSDGWSPANDRPQTHRGQILTMPLSPALEAEKRGMCRIIEYAAPSAEATST